MSSVAEQAWAAMFLRLTAPAFPNVPAASIRRAHRTRVTRENAPAIHLIEGLAKPTATKRCDWQWEMEGTIAVFARDDVGLKAADPHVIEVVRRINPEAGTPYADGVSLDLLRIGPGRDGDGYTAIADEDATRVDIDFRFTFGTRRWTLEVAA